jgi:hypothetical protein
MRIHFLSHLLRILQAIADGWNSAHRALFLASPWLTYAIDPFRFTESLVTIVGSIFKPLADERHPWEANWHQNCSAGLFRQHKPIGCRPQARPNQQPAGDEHQSHSPLLSNYWKTARNDSDGGALCAFGTG